ncbi:hypothetical protein [Zobellia uliginosa]|nr:hypothetical protein [Zobellia uliginosa]
MNNLSYKKALALLAVFFLAVALRAQEEDSEKNTYQRFQDIEAVNEQLNFFFNSPDLYRENSTYDWLDLINIYLNAAIKEDNVKEIEYYKLMQARIYYDLGDYDKSLAISKELYADKEDLDNNLKSKLLDIMDDNYGQLTMYTEQIEIRKEQRELGINENVAFYDIYANLGMYRKAMEHYR